MLTCHLGVWRKTYAGKQPFVGVATLVTLGTKYAFATFVPMAAFTKFALWYSPFCNQCPIA